MATSLAAQLQKLKAPQTSLLLQDKKRASLLFDPKEAANYDRQTIYELGVAGLDELKSLNARFSEFESTLFDLSSQSFERAVQSKDVNKKLNTNIKKFFFLLSPYVLLKPAHKALEWLVNRFHIHQYNVDDLLMFALPYHESRIFIRIVQLVDLSSESNRWHWLEPLQKKGVSLSKNTLLNHASANQAFLQLLCDSTISAVKEHGPYAGVLSTLLAFYSTTVLGILDRCKRGVSEPQMIHILNALQHGLKSSVLDFAAASYIIVGRLVTTNALSSNILQALVDRITKMHHTELQTEKAMLLILIYQSQKQKVKNFPPRALSRLAEIKETPVVFGLLAANGFDVIPFLVPLLRAAVDEIQTQVTVSTANMRSLIENVLNEVHYSDNGAELVIRMFIEAFDISKLEEASRNSPKAADETNSPQEVTHWYAKILQQLERSYPSVFDKAVCRALKGHGISKSQATTLKQMLGFELQLDLFDKLHHSKSKIRAGALICLAKQSDILKEKDEQTLKDSLMDVLKDDSATVVLAAFSFPVPVLQRILTSSSLHSALVKIIQNHILGQGSDSKWVHVIPKVINTLTEIGEGDDMQELGSLVALLPQMIVDPKHAKAVVASPFGSRNNFLKQVKRGLNETKTPLEGICNVLANKPGALPLESVLEYGQKCLLKSNQAADCLESRYALLLLLGASLPHNSSAEQSLQVLQLASSLIQEQKVSACSEENKVSVTSLLQCLAHCQKGFMPLEGFLHVVQTIISRTNLKTSLQDSFWIDLETQSPSTKLLVQIYCILSAGCALEASDAQSAYVATLKSFLKIYFPSHQKQIEFLSNFWASHRVISSSNIQSKELSLDIQVRSLRLGALFLSKCKNIKWATTLASNNVVVPSLLVALCCPSHPVRKAALDVVQVMTKSYSIEESYHFLFTQIDGSKQEMSLDAEQLQLVLYSSLSPDPIVRRLLEISDRSSASGILNALLTTILSKKTPSYITASLLSALTSVNSVEILRKLLPLALDILLHCKSDTYLNPHHSTILCNIVNRLDSLTAHIFKDELMWTIMTELLTNQHTAVLKDVDRNTCPAELACCVVTRELWEALPLPRAPVQQRLLSFLISAGTEAESPSVLSAVARSVKQLTIDASLIVNELNKMKDISVAPANANQIRRHSTVTQILEMKEWRCGMTLLELLQNKKKLSSVHLLLPVLFNLLKKCLYFEEQAPLEYAKQLLLSCILHCCQKLSPDGAAPSTSLVPTQVLDVEAVVHCVRGTQNPQTHHHALLLLAYMASMVPEQVLLNIMAIFTFMGSLVLRQDDAYSFQIISKIVDTIIPILIKASVSGTISEAANAQLDATIASVMRVFVDALVDIPEHRRLSLFHKLLTTLDPQQHLWLFLCLVMESHTMHHSENTSDNKKTQEVDSRAPKRIEVALQIVSKFPPDTVLLNCIRIIKYLLLLPMEKGADCRRPVLPAGLGNLQRYNVKSLFDVEHHTPKKLRHYKYTIVTFLSALLSSLPFVNQVTSMDENATDVLVPVYMEFLEVLLAFIQVTSRQSDVSSGTPTAKYWKVMAAQSYDILDKVNALLPSKLFLSVVRGLITHELPSLRRKAMELLNSRLSSTQSEIFLVSCDSNDLLSLLEPLVSVVKSIETLKCEELNDEILLNQQTALLSIKLLAKHLAYDNYVIFKPILENMTFLICKGKISNSNLLASVVLCAAELYGSLRAHAIASLPVLMPAFIKLLASQIALAPDVVQVSLAASLYRIVESLGAFLSPYLCPLLVALCGLSASHLHDEDDQCRTSNVAAKLKSTRQKISTSIPTRVLVPAIENAYKDLVERKQLDGIGPLMGMLAESFTGLVSADLTALQSSLTDFFLSALQFRSLCIPGVSAIEVDEVENHVINALVAFVLKLSEASFRPLYFKLFDWATRIKEHKLRTITFYRLSCGIAECLKGLYVSFAGHFLKNAAELLDHCNLSKVGEEDKEDSMPQESNSHRYEDLYFGGHTDAEDKCATLMVSILKTLHYVFLYDSQNFLSKERFETLMQPIVDQLENTLGGIDGLRQRASDVLVPCVAQMAVACTDDTLWKLLNYQLLLKTRHAIPMVRLVALESVCSVARKLGEGFLPLLPETVPFLAELLEDEEENIETACRRAVQDLEQVLGEPIQKYF